MEGHSTLDDIRRITISERFLLALLCFVNIINYMDRVGIAGVLVTIQEYFSIGDDKGGLLQTALLIAYTLSAPVFGYCGDRYSRKLLLISCIALWALSTVIGALSKQYSILLVSRIFVGIGQSGYTTITPTVISDVALRGARTVFLSCFYLGIPIGAGLGYVAVATVAQSLNDWSYGLCVGPVLCVIGISLMFLVSFPKRGEKEAAELGATPIESTSYKLDLLYLLDVPSFNLVTLAFVQICFYVGALTWWAPKCLYHGFKLIPNGKNVDVATVSFSFGLITVLTGFLGVLMGLILSRYLRPRFARADPLICAISLLVALPFVTSALSTMAISQATTFVLIFFSELNTNLNWALVTDMLLYTIVPTRRTSAQGLSMLISHGIGDCISPYIVGVLSEFLKHNIQFTNGSFFLPYEVVEVDETNTAIQNFHALQMSLFFVAFVLLLGTLCFSFASFYIVKDAEKAKKVLVTGQGNA